MKRIRNLGRFQKVILIVMGVMILGFAAAYAAFAVRDGFEYRNQLLIPKQEEGRTVYSGKLNGEQIRFWVYGEGRIEFQYGDERRIYTIREAPDAVPEEVRQERAARLMEIQEQISEEKLAARVGTTCEVLIDEVTEDHVAVGRSMYEAPDVDGVITLENARSLKAGDLVRARITASSTHDLEATLVEGFGASLKFNR